MLEVFRIISPKGHIYWYKVGTRECHREDGPAYISEYKNFKVWYFHGKRHRLDGPAVESINNYYLAWYFHGQYINCKSQEEFERIIKLKAFW